MRGEVAAVPEGGLLVEGVRGGEVLQVAGVKLRHHLDDFDGHGVADGGEGVAVAKEQGGVAAAGAGGGEGVAVNGGIGGGDGGESRGTDGDGLGGVGNVGAPPVGVFLEGFDLGRKVVDGDGPFLAVAVVAGDNAFERSHVGIAEGVEVNVVLARNFVHKLADQSEPADRA